MLIIYYPRSPFINSQFSQIYFFAKDNRWHKSPILCLTSAIHFALLRRKFTINEKRKWKIEIRNIFCVFALCIMSRFQTRCAQYGQSQSEKKSKLFLTSTTTASKYVHTQEAHNLHQLKSPLSDPNLLGKSTSKCEHCETRFT